VSESIDSQLLTLAKAPSAGGAKSSKSGSYEASGSGDGFAAVFDQQRASPGEVPRGGTGGTVAAGKDLPVERQGDAAGNAAVIPPDTPVAAAEGSGEAARDTAPTDTGAAGAVSAAALPPDDGAAKLSDRATGGRAMAGADLVDSYGFSPTSESRVAAATGAALPDHLLPLGADGEAPGSEAGTPDLEVSASRPAVGATTGEPAPLTGGAMPATADGAGMEIAPSVAAAAGGAADGPRLKGAIGGATAEAHRAVAGVPAAPRPAQASTDGVPGAGDASTRSPLTQGPAPATPAADLPLALNADAAPAESGDSLRATMAQRGDSSPSLSLPAAAGMTSASAGATAQTGSSQPLDTDAPLYAMDAAPDDAEFPHEMSSRLSLMLRDGSREARLQLHPAELGRVQVTINTDGDQARVVFVAESAAAREAIEQAMPRLREALAQQGMDLAQADVGQQGPSGERSNGRDDLVRPGMSSADERGAEADAAAAETVTLRATSRLDLYA
jgi:flagellar hook-length control protein FliK